MADGLTLQSATPATAPAARRTRRGAGGRGGALAAGPSRRAGTAGLTRAVRPDQYHLRGLNGDVLASGTVSGMDGEGDLKLQRDEVEPGALITIAAFTHTQE